MKPIFSIIIPNYNNRNFLPKLVQAIVSQSFTGGIECIFLDDNSTDDSLEILDQLVKDEISKRSDISVKVIHDGQNMKQGYRRNQGIKMAEGDWVLFVDSDDYIHSDTLRLCYERIVKNDKADMVYFNYAYDNRRTKRHQAVVSSNLFANNRTKLVGEECEILLGEDPYFTVNKAYKKSFLLENNIKFGEGYFYEDVVFFVNVAIFAEEIELLPNICYNVVINENSTTQQQKTDNTHPEDLLKAMEDSYEAFEYARRPLSAYNSIKYFMNRSLLYTETRSCFTEKEKVEHILKVTTSINDNVINNPLVTVSFPKKYASYLYYALFGMKYVQRNDAKNALRVYKLYRNEYKTLVEIVDNHRRSRHSYKTKVHRKYNLLRASNFVDKSKKNANDAIDNNEETVILENRILLLGFDYKYTGNSKYLFDELVKIYGPDQLKLTISKTAEELEIPEEYVVTPRSPEFWEWIKTSKIVVGETWTPLDFKLTEEQTFIQMWHGQPLKKLLFDSNEPMVVSWNKTHKANKSLDINRWDYLVSETPFSDEKFKSAFAIEDDKFLNAIYPRNSWLLNNKDNKELKTEIRERLEIPEDKKVILYVPTWRDYNFRKKDIHINDNYKLNVERFKDNLENSEDYILLAKDHGISNQALMSNYDRIVPLSDDVQEYLLIADIVVSDYSSVIFDALAIDIPFYLLFKDIDYYQSVRGVYEDAEQDFKEVIAYTERELANLINGNQFQIENREKYEISSSLMEVSDVIKEVVPFEEVVEVPNN